MQGLELPSTILPSHNREPHMLAQLLVTMSFQLLGEVVVSCLGLSFPGPLCGLLLLLVCLQLAEVRRKLLPTPACC